MNVEDPRSPRSAVTSLHLQPQHLHIYPEVLDDRGRTVVMMKARGLFARREVGGSPEAGR